MVRLTSVWAGTGLLLVAVSVAAAFAADDAREERGGRGEKKVSLDSLPAAVRDAIVREAGGGAIEGIAELTRDQQTVYEVDVVANGRETEIRIGADGELLGKKDEGEKRAGGPAKAARAARDADFTRAFGLERCSFSTTGKNPFFVLEPGYSLTLERSGGGETGQLVVTVLDETENVGGIETRVVEERETENGQLVEVSRNYFAYCNENGGVFYFGEQTTKYANGVPGPAQDSWRADAEGCAPGLAMPGLALIGSRYYQEWAPGVAQDRAEIAGVDDALQTPAGAFAHCLKVAETNPLEPGEREYKMYAPGVGLIQDEDLVLTKRTGSAP